MKAFINLNISKKLVSAFLVVAVLAGVLGGIGTLAVQNMTNEIDKLNQEATDPIADIVSMVDAFHRMRVALRDAVLASDSDLRANEIQTAKKHMSTLEKYSDDFGKTLKTESAIILFETYQEDYNALKPQIEVLFEYINNDGLETAMYMLRDDSDTGKLFSDTQDALNNLSQGKLNYADQLSLEAKKSGNQAISLMVGLSVVVFIISIGLGFFISRLISRPVQELVQIADKIALGDVDISVEAKTKDEIGTLMKSFGRMVDNIKEQAGAAEKIAAGDLSLEFEPKSDKDVLAISLISVIDTLRALIKEAEEMTEAAESGQLDYRGNSLKFKGGYHEIIEGFNKTLDGIINPLKVSAEYMERISKGDIPEKITGEYYGDLNDIKNNINTCIDAVNALIEDAKMLAEAAVEGRLSVRADASRHGGDFAKIISGVNNTLDSVIGPLSVAADYIDQIGRGEIPQTITDTYYGDFNNLKNSINACIDGLGALVEGKDVLVRMSNNDCSVQVEGHYQGIYAEIAESINGVSDRLRHIVDVVNNVAVGNLEDLDNLRNVGKRSENDTLVPAFVTMIQSIKSMVEETEMLSNAAVAGKLSTRGNAGNFSGEYAKVIEGINSTLDAVIEPIQEASTVLKEMANGNLHVMVEGNYQGDHAEIKEALNETLINLQNYISEISHVLAEIGNGNLAQTITAEYRGEFVEIKDSLNNIIASLNQVLGNINVAADQVASSSRQVSVGSQALSQGSTEQASSIEELTASISEIASQTKQNAVNAN